MDYGKISLFFTKVGNFSLDFIIYEYRKSIESDCILEMDTANREIAGKMGISKGSDISFGRLETCFDNRKP